MGLFGKFGGSGRASARPKADTATTGGAASSTPGAARRTSRVSGGGTGSKRAVALSPTASPTEQTTIAGSPTSDQGLSTPAGSQEGASPKFDPPKRESAASAPHEADKWKMITSGSPLFKNYLKMAWAAGWDALFDGELAEVCSSDALIVVDMQNDFIPVDDMNPYGGGFGVAEGGNVVEPVLSLMEKFAAAGGLVVSTRDYHPVDHCSFLPSGGHFPKHCVQGSVGSHFYKTIGECVQNLRRLGRRSEVVFKGYHEGIDSFGCLEYPEDDSTLGRLSNRKNELENKKDCDLLHGCSLISWTGCACLKCSNLEEDVNAPPDVMSILRRESLGDMLKKEGIKRVFACGLAMDFCVMDTTLNASSLGFDSVYLVVDAARSAYLPQVGKFDGFLSDPVEMKEKMAARNVRITSTSALVPSAEDKVSPLNYLMAADDAFPKSLGTFALAEASGLTVKLDMEKMTYVGECSEKAIADALEKKGAKPEGKISSVSDITLGVPARMALGIPDTATKVAWAYPVDAGSFSSQAWGYLSITTPIAAFFVFGGFVYLDDKKAVVAVKAFSMGTGLSFQTAQKWPGAVYSKALAGKWSPVTWPLPQSRGAKLFTWIGPKGSVAPASGEKPVETNHGAFVFLFHDNPEEHDDRDVIFHVGRMTEQRRSLGRFDAKGVMDMGAGLMKQGLNAVNAGSRASAKAQPKAKPTLKTGKSMDNIGRGESVAKGKAKAGPAPPKTSTVARKSKAAA